MATLLGRQTYQTGRTIYWKESLASYILFYIAARFSLRSIVNTAAAPAASESEMIEAAIPLGDTYIEKDTPAFIRTVLALFSGGFATFALLYCVQPMMPVLSREFSINAAQSSLILSVSTAMLAIGLLITGPISDRLGRKPVMVFALFSAAFFTIASALMPTWEGVLVTRALVGLSLSGLAAVGMTYLSEEIHPQHIGLAMGLYIGGNAIGGMSGRLITGVLSDFVSWHTSLLIMGLIALGAAGLFWKFLPPSRNFRPNPLNARNLLEGFVLQFRDAGLPLLFLEGFLLMGAFVTLFNYIGYRLLADPYNLSQAVVGLFSVVYLSGIYSSAKIGALADRLGRRNVLWAVIVLMLMGLALTLFAPLAVVVIGVLLFTFGFFGAHSVASSWIGRRAIKAKGQASSLYLFSYYVGSSVAGTGGGVFWHYAGWNGIGVFIGLVLLAALGVALKLAKVQPLAVNVQV
jgi:YNFM family putative membrane transporter